MQGSVFTSVTRLPALARRGSIECVDAPLGVAVVSQTCDNVRAPQVMVSPVVRLDGDELANVSRGSTARFAALPAAGEGLCVQLDIVATISKDLLRQEQASLGVVLLPHVRELAQAIGRRFSRFAFPDEVVAWLAPLRTVAHEKARRPASPEGRALGRVRQIRVRSENGWETAPFVLGFTFLLDDGELTFDTDSEPIVDQELTAWLVGKTAPQIADRIDQAGPSQKAVLMLALCEEWIRKCADRGPGGVVLDYSVDLTAADEYTLASYWDSEALDLDHLSSPRTQL